MIDLYIRILLGHLFGDYLFQNNWMALNKKEKWIPCVTHCLVYTICVSLFLIPELLMMNDAPMFLFVISGIFLSHLVLDKTSLIDKWLDKIGGRSYRSVIEMMDDEMMDDARKQFYITYTAIVHTVADNTIHLFLLYLISILMW